MGPRWGVEVEESLSMAARIELTKKYARAYAEAPKKGKTQILDQVVEVTGLEPGPCPPAAGRLVEAGPSSGSGYGRGDRPLQDARLEVLIRRVLQKVWAASRG